MQCVVSKFVCEGNEYMIKWLEVDSFSRHRRDQYLSVVDVHIYYTDRTLNKIYTVMCIYFTGVVSVYCIDYVSLF